MSNYVLFLHRNQSRSPAVILSVMTNGAMALIIVYYAALGLVTVYAMHRLHQLRLRSRMFRRNQIHRSFVTLA